MTNLKHAGRWPALVSGSDRCAWYNANLFTTAKQNNICLGKLCHWAWWSIPTSVYDAIQERVGWLQTLQSLTPFYSAWYLCCSHSRLSCLNLWVSVPMSEKALSWDHCTTIHQGMQSAFLKPERNFGLLTNGTNYWYTTLKGTLLNMVPIAGQDLTKFSGASTSCHSSVISAIPAFSYSTKIFLWWPIKHLRLVLD